jgi:AcrR family transcriptional regulator
MVGGAQVAAVTTIIPEHKDLMIPPHDNSGRRMELVLAAASLFRDMGYEKTTVRDLGNAVGLQSGSLFYHFRSKEEILVAVMALGISRTTEQLEAALSQAQSLREQLAALFHVHLNSLLGENQAALEVMLYEWRSVSPDARPGLIVLRDRYEKLWQDVLDQAAREGMVKPDTPLLRRTLLGSLHWTVQWFREEGELSIDELAEHMLELVLLR